MPKDCWWNEGKKRPSKFVYIYTHFFALFYHTISREKHATIYTLQLFSINTI